MRYYRFFTDEAGRRYHVSQAEVRQELAQHFSDVDEALRHLQQNLFVKIPGGCFRCEHVFVIDWEQTGCNIRADLVHGRSLRMWKKRDIGRDMITDTVVECFSVGWDIYRPDGTLEKMCPVNYRSFDEAKAALVQHERMRWGGAFDVLDGDAPVPDEPRCLSCNGMAMREVMDDGIWDICQDCGVPYGDY